MFSQCEIPEAHPPFFSSPPDKKALMAWVAAHDNTRLYEIAQTMASNIQYVTYDAFLVQCKAVVRDFHAKHKGDYILLVTQGEFAEGINACSELWVSGLCLQKCGLRKPTAIVTMKNIKQVIAETGVSTVLCLDDAVYSGRHFQRELKILSILFRDSKDFTCYIGIPYQSRKLRQLCHGHQFVRHLHSIEIQMTEDLLTGKQIELLIDMGLTPLLTTLTYFDHRFAASVSVLGNLQTGDLLTGQASPHRIVPLIFPPYHRQKYHAAQFRQKDIMTVPLGKRTQTPIPADNLFLRALLRRRGCLATSRSIEVIDEGDQKECPPSFTVKACVSQMFYCVVAPCLPCFGLTEPSAGAAQPKAKSTAP